MIHLGDFAFGERAEQCKYAEMWLPGHKFIVRGNHDKHMNILVNNGYTWIKYGNSYYIEAKEFEIIGQNPNTHHTFTAQKSTSLQEFDLDDICKILIDVKHEILKTIEFLKE